MLVELIQFQFWVEEQILVRFRDYRRSREEERPHKGIWCRKEEFLFLDLRSWICSFI